MARKKKTARRGHHYFRKPCPHCKLRQSWRTLAPCPKEPAKRCKCCDQCRRECWLEATS